MKIKYLSYRQAAAITSEHQHLIGEPFSQDTGTAHKVAAVVIAPYSRILQWSFARNIIKGMPPADALRQWTIDRYDVVVLSQNPGNPADFQVLDLRTYLAERGMEFNTVRYRRVAA